MRRLIMLVLLPAFACPAFADDTSVAAPPPHKARLTWMQRFAQANLAHDGHLTLTEAQAGYVSVAKHFNEIDATHKGYVTLEDIKAWHIAHRAAHRAQAASQPVGMACAPPITGSGGKSVAALEPRALPPGSADQD